MRITSVSAETNSRHLGQVNTLASVSDKPVTRPLTEFHFPKADFADFNTHAANVITGLD
jgi:hypothetical protein